jgi:hypothetical protein
MEPSLINRQFMKVCLERGFRQFPVRCKSAVRSPAVAFAGIPHHSLGWEKLSNDFHVLLFIAIGHKRLPSVMRLAHTYHQATVSVRRAVSSRYCLKYQMSGLWRSATLRKKQKEIAEDATAVAF